MSGQPVKTLSDANKFRNEYMEALQLQTQINDMNLQANKNYLANGTLPAVSQMKDNRTTSEIMMDLEKLKTSIVEDLSPIANAQFAHAIIQGVQENFLNVDNSLLRFLAQRAPDLASQLKKVYKFGIVGDANDVDTLVQFIANMYSERKNALQSTKSFINSNTSTPSGGRTLSSQDIDRITTELKDIIRRLGITYSKVRNNQVLDAMKTDIVNIVAILDNLKLFLPNNEEMKYIVDNLYNEDLENVGSADDLKAVYEILNNMPKLNQVQTLLDKADMFLKNQNLNGLQDVIMRLANEFAPLLDDNNFVILEDFKNKFKIPAIQDINETNRIARQNERQQQQQERYIDSAKKVYVVNPEDDAAWVRMSNRGQNNIQNNPSVDLSRVANIPNRISSSSSNVERHITEEVHNLSEEDIDTILSDYFQEEYLTIVNEDINTKVNRLIDKLIEAYHDGDYTIGDLSRAGYTESEGLGLKKTKRRVGRPRGSGIVKTPKPPAYVGFGVNEINQRKLKDGILAIRRNTRTSYNDMPAKRISKNLQNVFNTIIGGGVPKFNDLNSLSEEEKNYLHKVVQRSNLEDKLSIPAPSKDKLQKEIDQFEIMKGEIMSGNDSKELVKKFKIAVLKLSRNGLLPKSETQELLEALIELGY